MPEQFLPEQPSELEVSAPERIADMLMPYEEYAALPISEKSTYQEMTLQSDGQSLFYFGALHTYDPEHQMFEALDGYWQNFLSQTDSSSAVTFYEGQFLPVGDDKVATILSGGESAYIRLLAQRAGIKEFCPEPGRSEQIAYLQQHFDDEEVITFYFVRALAQWHRLVGEKPTAEAYLQPYINGAQRYITFNEGYSMADLADSTRAITGEDLPLERQNSLQRLISPSVWQSSLNEISRDLNQYRDIRIVEHLLDAWHQGSSLFLVYGNAHLLRQRQALEVLVAGKKPD